MSKNSIFVGNLSFDTTEDDLWNHFSECGDIKRARIVIDKKTKKPKGCGYVSFKVFSVNYRIPNHCSSLLN